MESTLDPAALTGDSARMGIVEKINQMADAINAAKTPEQKQKLFALTLDYVKWRTVEQHQERMKDPAFKAAFHKQMKAILEGPNLRHIVKNLRRD